MRKFLALLLAVMLIASMSVTAFAEDGSTNVTEPTEGVEAGTVTVNTGREEGTITKVYYVTVEWKTLDFTFTFTNSDNIKWDYTSHTYKDYSNPEAPADLSGSWGSKKIEEAITVENHSNTAVTISAKFEETGNDNATENGVKATVAIYEGDETLASGEETTDDNPDKVVYSVSVGESESLTEDVPTAIEGFKIGVINIGISDAVTNPEENA